MLKGPVSASLRRLRAWIYRWIPAWSRETYAKKLAGYERRWGLEASGFTKRDFFGFCKRRLLAGIAPGLFYELQAGDGLVGSLGLWLERENPAWKVEAWEHRYYPVQSLVLHRPRTVVHRERKIHWTGEAQGITTIPVGVTIRGAREAASLCRAIRKGILRPQFIGIWNPSRRPIWFRRLSAHGFKLWFVYERMEFYKGRF